MEREKTYNGWTNYETWCVVLWLENDEGTYRYWRECARAHAELAKRDIEPHLTPAEGARIKLAEQMREEVERDDVVPAASLYADLLNSAFEEVNWVEVADAFLVDFVTNDEEGG